MNANRRWIVIPSLFLFCISLFHPTVVWAHVKWFSNFSFADKPRTMAEAMDPAFWWLFALSVFCVGLLVILDYKLFKVKWTKNVSKWLEGYKDNAVVIMRVGAGAALLLSFQSGVLFEPELTCSTAVGWVQFFLVLLLLFDRTVIISGAGIIALYLYAVAKFGWFHMLDYPIFAGVGYYLLVSGFKSEKVRGTGLIMLYVTVGFSLAWVAIEKLLYPQWGLYVIQQHPQLALGLDMRFFLTAAAFIEISLGYLIMICLLERPLALVITLVFFLTTLVFGKTEVIGHTIIHASLIVFLIEGPGTVYKTPVAWHKHLTRRVAFACVNFVLLTFILLAAYQHLAYAKYRETIHEEAAEGK